MNRIQKVGIGVVLGIVVVMAVGYWIIKKTETLTRTFFYLLAPPMPAVVNESMSEILAHLESVLKTNAPQVLATLRPGISAGEIGRLEQQYNFRIPDEIAAIYEWHDGAPANTNYFADLPNTGSFADLIPGHHFESLEDMLEQNKETRAVASGIAKSSERAIYRAIAGQRDNWYCLLDDGESGGYFFDPTRRPAEGAVFSTVTEEGYFLFFPSPKNLIAGIAKCYEQGAFRIKPDSKPLQLDEDFDQSAKIWKEFGASNQQGN